MSATDHTAPTLPTHTRIAIVGAGPTGLALAMTLASAGVDFVLLDQQAEGANTSRAGVVHARTLEVLDELGASAELLRRGITIDRFSVRDGSRRLISLDFAKLPTAHPYTLMIPQSETEAVLVARLRELGGDVHRSHEVTDLRQDADGVTLTVQGPDGPPAQLRAEYAVGADGMHSTVRESAGIGFTGESYGESFVLADVTMDWTPGREEVSLLFDAAGLVVVAPLPGDRYRVVATVDDAPPVPDAAFVQQILDERAHGQGTITGLVWSSRFHVHHRVADHYRAGRLLLAGDAAHVHSPAGGQGMNTGIQDGYTLGLALTRAMNSTDGTSDAVLDSYETTRRPVAQRVVAFTDRMTRLATTRNRTKRAARNALLPLVGRLPAFRTRLTSEIAELNYR
jgi:2-polyprenyl-6-methoxyphenol hydroxylase-like FAD-dependent oxidoreductase